MMGHSRVFEAVATCERSKMRIFKKPFLISHGIK
ncbi:hypothetical protein SOVF_182170, partial [Spinacia oleracea]